MLPHQVEAIDTAVHALELPPNQKVPAEGLRTEVAVVTKDEQSMIALKTVQRLDAKRVLVLNPSTPNTLTQAMTEWRESAGPGTLIGICISPKEKALRFPCATNPHEVLELTRHVKRVTAFSTYSAASLNALQFAHSTGLPRWSLIILNEAHRADGYVAKACSAVHENAKIPSDRRLYMTALFTARRYI